MENKELISRILQNNEDTKAQVWLFTYYQYNLILYLDAFKREKNSIGPIKTKNRSHFGRLLFSFDSLQEVLKWIS